MPRPLLSSAGSLGSVPRLHRSYERLRLPAAHPASLRCLRSAVPSVHPLRFALGGGGRAAAKPGVCSPGSPFRHLSLGDDRISQVPRKPLVACPALRPRREGHASASLPACPCCFPCAPHVGSRVLEFRGSITWPTTSLCTLRSRSHPRTTQHSLPAGVASPCRTGLSPAGLHRRISRIHGSICVSFSNGQSLPGARCSSTGSDLDRPRDSGFAPIACDPSRSGGVWPPSTMAAVTRTAGTGPAATTWGTQFLLLYAISWLRLSGSTPSVTCRG